MLFFLLNVVLRGIRHSSVEQSATKVPKKRKKATKRHQDTVRWVLHHTNRPGINISWPFHAIPGPGIRRTKA